MAGIPDSSGEQANRKQIVLDYLCEHIGEARGAEQLAEATGLSLEEVEIAAEALAYEDEIAKEYIAGGQKVYRRKA